MTLNDQSSKGPKNPRRHGRVRCQDIACSLGELMDLSASGMRVRLPAMGIVDRAEQGDELTVTLQGLDGPIRLLCRVVWSRKVGIGWGRSRREVGLVFLEVGERERRGLSLLGRAAASNETILDDIDRFRHAG